MNMQSFFAFILVGGLVVSEVRGMETEEVKIYTEDEILAPDLPPAAAPQVQGEPAPAQPQVQDEHAQAEAFHARVQELHPDWFEGNVLSYYKRIDPVITSTPPAAAENGWSANGVSINGNQVLPDADGTYAHDGISFNLNGVNFATNLQVTIPVSYNNKTIHVPFAQSSSKKVPVFTRFDGIDSYTAKAQENQFCLKSKITLIGRHRESNERPALIEITFKNNQPESIKLQGIQFIFDKDHGVTRILFDLIDAEDTPIDSIKSVVCRHAEHVNDNTVFCFKDHQIYECDGNIYNFFDSIEARRRWVPDEANFYDLINKRVVALPNSYANANNHQETPHDPAAFIINDGYDSFYQLERLEAQNAETNDYVYNANGVFYALLPYTAIYRDFFSQDPNNTIRLDYLLQVKKPGFRFHESAHIEGIPEDTDQNCVYQRVRSENDCYWAQVFPLNTERINIDDRRAPIEISWPEEPLTTQEVKQWCDAGQKFFTLFNACIHRCNREIVDNLRVWNKLNCLDLSRMQLDEEIRWNDLFTAVGTMRQLQQLSFRYNHPVPDIFNEYSIWGDQYQAARNYFTNLGQCIRELINLKTLDIQGLWLKNHAQLGSGCTNEDSVSREVAILTDFIFEKREEIISLINNIGNLPRLESLYIDALPNHLNSIWAKQTTRQNLLNAVPVITFGTIFFPLLIIAKSHDNFLINQLIQRTANTLARKQSLRAIFVFSPGGNCVDYFSQAFRARLAASRAAHPNLQPLAITAGVLQ